MSIQSAWNQALSSVARVKLAKTALAEAKNITKSYEKQDKEIAELAKKWAKEHPNSNPEEFFTPTIDLTKPNSGASISEDWSKAVKPEEQKAQQSLSGQIAQKNNQKEGFKERKNIILDPNKNMDFTYRKTKVNMEEENNGK